MADQKEPLADEFARLVKEYRTADERDARLVKAEAWNLIADFAEANSDAIVAGLRAKSAGVKVPGLEWSREPPYQVARVPGLRLTYSTECVWDEGRFLYCILSGISINQQFATLDAAKAAAQADYERRVLSALEPAALSKQEVVLGAGDVAMLDQAWREASPVIASPVPAEPSAEGWRPIETANRATPEWVFLFVPGHGPARAIWRRKRKWWESHATGREITAATHWRPMFADPLPPAPHGEGA